MTLRMLYLPVSVLVLASLGGCDLLGGADLLDGATEDDPTFTVDKTAYSAGEHVVLALTNNSFHEVGFNLSCSLLEPQEGQSLPAEVTDAVCQQYLGLLGAGQETRLSYRLHLDVPGGVYRFSTSVYTGEGLNNESRVFSTRFEVRR